ncbi:MAG: hypothetical protein J7L91_04055 [Candidatus Korarchaeota archaeon]|nr:hypothetical protein [Candidatus Korarchaeota archaeon]
MSIVIEALFETVRTLSLAGEYLPDDKLTSIIDLMAHTYVEALPVSDKTSFLESFELVKEAMLSKPPTDEDEDVVRLATYNLRQMEEKLHLDQENFRKIFLRKIEDDLGEDLANLVIMFERSIRSSR